MTQKPSIGSPDKEFAYRKFMLSSEVIALRWTCMVAITYMLLLVILDYWRVESYFYLVLFRVTIAVLLGVIVILTYKSSFSLLSFYTINTIAITIVVVFTFLMDFTAGPR